MYLAVDGRTDARPGFWSAGVLAAGRAPGAMAAAERAGSQRPPGPRADRPDRPAADPWCPTTWAGCGPRGWYRRGAARRTGATPTTPWTWPAAASCWRRRARRCTRRWAPGQPRLPRPGDPRGCCSCVPATAPVPRWPRRSRERRSGGLVAGVQRRQPPQVAAPEHGPRHGRARDRRPRPGRQAPERVHRGPVRLRDHPVRPGARGLPGVPRPSPSTSTGAFPTRPRPETPTRRATRPSRPPPPNLTTRIGFLLAAIAARRPFSPPGGVMTSPHEMVNVRYMVDDVAGGRRLLHRPPRLRAAVQRGARVRRRQPG